MGAIAEHEFWGHRFRLFMDRTDEGVTLRWESVGPVPEMVAEAFQFSMKQIFDLHRKQVDAYLKFSEVERMSQHLFGVWDGR